MPGKSPDAFRTISEVADWLQTPAHVLRFWESKFSQVKPVKRAGGRRYYRPADMALIGGIKKLLHDDGMTIKGVQKVLREQGIKYVSALSPPLDEDLEAMIEPAAAAEPARPPSPETGRVLEFSSRPEPKSAGTGDLFGGDEDSGKTEAPPVEDAETVAPEAPEAAETPPAPAPEDVAAQAAPPADPEVQPEAPTSKAEDLPDFVQKPLSERLAEDAAASPPEAEAPVGDSADVQDVAEEAPVEEASAGTDAPEEDAPAEETTVDGPRDLDIAAKDMAPVADVASGEASDAETPTPETVAAHADEVAEDPAPVPDGTPEDEDAPESAKVPSDPLDHEIEAPAGVLTLLTSQEMRGIRHSAERIETLIIRVRNHHRAMNHASRR